MNAITIVLLAMSVAGQAGAVAPRPSALVGVWRFVKEVDRRSDGSIVPGGPADGYDGLLVYTADGIVSVQIYPKGRQWVAATATPEELRDTVNVGTAYYGRYQVDMAKRTVTHQIDRSVDPAFNDVTLVRSYILTGETLILSGTYQDNGETCRFEISWSRLK